MEFCEVCDNMLYLNYQDGLSYVCKKCGHQKPVDGSVVSSMTFMKPDQVVPINKYTKMDPTLPRIKNVPCPTEKCENHQLPSDIIYYRYNHSELKYIYICPKCDISWKPVKD